MSDPPECNSLCERCSLLSFDDAAIGGQEVVGEDGIARLGFLESKIECRPSNWQQRQDVYRMPPDYRLIRLDWELDEILPDMPRLSLSSQLGCVFCQALRRLLEETLAKEAEIIAIDDGLLNLVAYLCLIDGGIEGLMIEGIDSHSSFNRVIRTFFPIEADSCCCVWLGAQSERNASYLHPTNIRKMRQLLEHCTSTCHPDTQSSFIPTRLIDIGDDASAVSRLVPSSGIEHTQQKKYAALSYCWGNAKDAELQFKTEKASLEDRYVGLPSELMTSTTKDAIALARAIGIRYLWIDALCIIQDDKDDWSHESSQMSLVYRHAFVTLCSLNSDSCHESFLNRAPVVNIPFQSTIRESINGSYLIRLRPRIGDILDRGRYRWAVASSQWDKRCWTFQERELSTRLLFFGSLKMHFACARCQWSEGDEAPRDRYESSSGVSDMITRFRDKRISYQELYEYWDWLVIQYGNRLVTFDKDRLPAIAGLAHIIGEALQDRYLAGLWKGDLHHGLTWRSGSNMLLRGLEAHIRDIKKRNYVAPSWSWASCPHVKGTRRHGTLVVEESTIVSVNTDTRSDDLYGQVSGGSLRLRGKLARIPDWLPNDEGTHPWSQNWVHDVNDNNDTYDSFIVSVTDWLHRDKEAGLENLVIMLLYRIENENKDEAKAPNLWALLLYPADELRNFYRVGVVESQGYDGYKEMRKWFENSEEETICII